MPFIELDGMAIHITVVRDRHGNAKKLTQRDMDALADVVKCLMKHEASRKMARSLDIGADSALEG